MLTIRYLGYIFVLIIIYLIIIFVYIKVRDYVYFKGNNFDLIKEFFY